MRASMSEGCSRRTERNPASASSVRPIRSCSLATHSRASGSVGFRATICSKRSSASTVRPDRASCSARLRSAAGDWHAMDRTSAVAMGRSMRTRLWRAIPRLACRATRNRPVRMRPRFQRQTVLRPRVRAPGWSRRGRASGPVTKCRDRRLQAGEIQGAGITVARVSLAP